MFEVTVNESITQVSSNALFKQTENDRLVLIHRVQIVHTLKIFTICPNLLYGNKYCLVFNLAYYI